MIYFLKVRCGSDRAKRKLHIKFFLFGHHKCHRLLLRKDIILLIGSNFLKILIKIINILVIINYNVVLVFFTDEDCFWFLIHSSPLCCNSKTFSLLSLEANIPVLSYKISSFVIIHYDVILVLHYLTYK